MKRRREATGLLPVYRFKLWTGKLDADSKVFVLIEWGEKAGVHVFTQISISTSHNIPSESLRSEKLSETQ